MEAVVLVGGKGTRLRPLTIRTPKPMLPAAGVPFLTHLLARAQAAGVDHAVLATSYKSEVFAAHFGDGSALGMRLDYVTETDPLGTGGGIRNVADRLQSAPDDPVLVLNGDILSGHDLGAQVAAHRTSGAIATLHLVRVPDPRAFGSVVTDAAGRVVEFVEKSPQPVTDQINAGTYVFARRLIDAIPAGQVVSVERDTFPALLADGVLIHGYVDASYWLDVGTPAAFVRASADLVRGLVSSPAVPAAGEQLVADGARVDETATVVAGSFVDVGAVIGARATVESSVVMAGARIGADCVITNSVVGPGASIGASCRVADAVIADGADVGDRNELIDGARVWPDVVLPAVALRFSTDA
ncbi:MAG TPA: NDP-sugar synthase [Mycobacteriales bacterium]|nr:NDP-sugar synthase [Mycobacteriales bacterium]